MVGDASTYGELRALVGVPGALARFFFF